jgi:hypothetical protein
VLARARGHRPPVGAGEREDRAAAGAWCQGLWCWQQRVGCAPPRTDLCEQDGAGIAAGW